MPGFADGGNLKGDRNGSKKMSGEVVISEPITVLEKRT